MWRAKSDGDEGCWAFMDRLCAEGRELYAKGKEKGLVLLDWGLWWA